MTIGNFNHPPNADSVKFIRKKIWPSVREKLPTAKMRVYGAYPNQQARQLDDPDFGFHIMGRVGDVGEVMRSSRVCLAPLRFGAGLKGKLLEAMQYGLPSVTTSIGAEGIQGECRWGGMVADDYKALISAAVDLYGNKKRWTKAQDAGAHIINHRFQLGSFRDTFQNRLNHLIEHIQEHRLKNFTGAMLRHHSMASTEYMSRWIEAKNRDGKKP
jgi:glycosyltransferase involved in cell wall biosynthesis